MKTLTPHDPVTAEDREQRALSQLEAMLSHSDDSLRIVDAQGTEVALPESAVALLRQIIHALAQRKIVTIVSLNRQLTTQQAADLLNISRPYLIKLLEQGEIPHTKTGTHRRIAFADLMRYKTQRDTESKQALADLIRLNEELGLYDL